MSNKINNRTLIDRFVQWEHDEGLLDLNINGFPLWQFSRFSVCLLFQKRYLGFTSGNSSDMKDKSFREIYQLLRASLFSFKESSHRNKGVDILFLHHSRRVKNEAGFFEDIYSDNLRKKFSKRSVSYEWMYNLSHLAPTDYPVFYLDDFELLIRAFKHFPLFGTRTLTNQIENISNAIDRFIIDLDIESNLNTDDNLQLKNQVCKILKKQYKVFFYANSIFTKYFKKKFKGIKFIIEVVHYEKNMFFNFFARKVLCDLKIIEVQHGTMGLTHQAYNYFAEKKLCAFPDYVLLWDEVWRNTRFPIPNSAVFTIGNPFLSRLNISRQVDNVQTILVISQGTIGRTLFLLMLQASADLPAFEFIFKPHPAEYPVINTYSIGMVIPSNFSINTDPNTSVYHLLNRASYVVGVYTTVLFEALYFKIPTLVVKLPGWETYEGIVHENLHYVMAEHESITRFFLDYKVNNTVNKICLPSGPDAIEDVISQIFEHEDL